MSKKEEKVADIIEPVVLPSGRRQRPSAKALQAVQNYIDNGGNQAKALRDAGYSQTSRLMQKPTIQAYLASRGFTKKSSEVIQKAQTASKTRRIYIEEYDPSVEGSLTDAEIRKMYANENIKIRQILHKTLTREKDGEPQKRRELVMFIPDWEYRIRATELGAKLTGELRPDNSGLQVNMQFNLDFLRRAEEELNQHGLE